MLRYLAQRALAFVPTLLGVSILIFFAIRMVPGDSIVAMLGTEAGMLSEAQRAALERYFGLNNRIEQIRRWQRAAQATSAIRCGTASRACRHPGTLPGDTGMHDGDHRAGNRLTWVLRRFPLTRSSIYRAVFALSGGAPNFLIARCHLRALGLLWDSAHSGDYCSLTEDRRRNLNS